MRLGHCSCTHTARNCARQSYHILRQHILPINPLVLSPIKPAGKSTITRITFRPGCALEIQHPLPTLYSRSRNPGSETTTLVIRRTDAAAAIHLVSKKSYDTHLPEEQLFQPTSPVQAGAVNRVEIASYDTSLGPLFAFTRVTCLRRQRLTAAAPSRATSGSSSSFTGSPLRRLQCRDMWRNTCQGAWYSNRCSSDHSVNLNGMGVVVSK